MRPAANLSLLTLSLGLFFHSAHAQSKAPNVVPGRSLGRISLGMTPSQVHKLLGKPDKTLRLSNGLLDDVYKAKTTRPKWTGTSLQTMRDTVEVLYKAGKAVQLEATSPVFLTRSGLSTEAPLSVLDRIIRPKRYSTYGYGGNDPGGYVKYYLDGQGIGLAFESEPHQDNWFNEAPAHAIIVHRKGVGVIPDAGGEFMSTEAQVPDENS
jgi:hypothetical protein